MKRANITSYNINPVQMTDLGLRIQRWVWVDFESKKHERDVGERVFWFSC